MAQAYQNYDQNQAQKYRKQKQESAPQSMVDMSIRSRASTVASMKSRTPRIRKVNGYIIFYDEVIGQGQFGTVCKAQLAADLLPDVSKKTADRSSQVVRSTIDIGKPIYACKIFDSMNFSQQEMDLVFKEVKIHSLVRSEYSIRHYQTIKTSTKIYMMQEYANCCDLEHLLKAKGTLRQEEARLIIRQLAQGISDVQKLNIVHRDMKLANILLHFPNNPNIAKFDSKQKAQFLKYVDLRKIKFQVKISDFGLSTVIDGTQSQLSIVGTPLYQSPQVLKRRSYNDKVDSWALGVMLFEMLVGITPFHCYDMQDLVKRINDGRFKVSSEIEPIKIETCLFLLDCMQALEQNRIKITELIHHPFISEEMRCQELNDINNEAFVKSQGDNKVSDEFNLAPNQSMVGDQSAVMENRFSNTEIYQDDVILTIRNSQQREILVGQLSMCDSLKQAGFNFADSRYFKKYEEFLTNLEAQQQQFDENNLVDSSQIVVNNKTNMATEHEFLQFFEESDKNCYQFPSQNFAQKFSNINVSNDPSEANAAEEIKLPPQTPPQIYNPVEKSYGNESQETHESSGKNNKGDGGEIDYDGFQAIGVVHGKSEPKDADAMIFQKKTIEGGAISSRGSISSQRTTDKNHKRSIPQVIEQKEKVVVRLNEPRPSKFKQFFSWLDRKMCGGTAGTQQEGRQAAMHGQSVSNRRSAHSTPTSLRGSLATLDVLDTTK